MNIIFSYDENEMALFEMPCQQYEETPKGYIYP